MTDALAAFRLSRLVTRDVIADPVRDRVIEAVYVTAGLAEDRRADAEVIGWSEVARNDADAPKLATLVTCVWCSSFWVAAGVVMARRFAPKTWDGVAGVLALSAAAGLLASVDRD